MIDLAATMRRLDYDTELFKNFVEIFNEDSPRLLAAIDSAIDTGDSTAVRRAAHALRGLAANFDARMLVETAHCLEEAAKGDLRRDDDALTLKIKNEVELVREALAECRQL